MTETADELLKKAAELTVRAKNLEIALSLEGRIAATLHDALCTHNHTDACSWGYEGDGCWTSEEDYRTSHWTWRKQARELLMAGGYGDKLLPLKGASMTTPICSAAAEVEGER